MDTTLQDLLVGRVIDGRYHVQSRIARGGMATVYLALDRRLERDVALKVMHDHLAADPEFVSRFVREARAAARLTSPNVVQVFDQGSDGPLLYLAMEYLPGRTLRDVLGERGALTPREALSVMGPVLDALGSAHRAGIVHRDVKPENVILTDDGRIKVADFGLARAASAAVTGGHSDTSLLGTVGYLAPELVSRGVADARADVYAAGVLLFEGLTGRLPYTGGDPVALAYRHVHERVPAPSAVVPGLPADFDELVLAATSHDPDLRPANGDEMLTELQELRRSLPDDVLDVRAVAPPGAPSDPRQVPANPAEHQETRALAIPSRGVPQLVPRLRVHEDDDVVHEGWIGGNRRRQSLVVLAVLVTALLAIFGAGWYFVAGPGANTTIPDGLTGQRAADAQRLLVAEGLRGTLREEFNDEIAKGQVVRTDPPSGQSVRKGGTVVLVVSKGPEQVEVPSLTGETVRDAQRALSAAGLELGGTEEKFDDEVAKGKIISTSPKESTLVAPGRSVDVVVSKGVRPAEVPNVVGKSRDEAERLLREEGLSASFTDVDYQFFGPLPGSVTAQDPGPGTQLKRGDPVRLTVVRGVFGQGGQGNQQQTVVPNVTGWNAGDAERFLRERGFRVNRQNSGERVGGQDPGPDTQVPLGTEVTLFLAN